MGGGGGSGGGGDSMPSNINLLCEHRCTGRSIDAISLHVISVSLVNRRVGARALRSFALTMQMGASLAAVCF
jgi:hypothetical protein